MSNVEKVHSGFGVKYNEELDYLWFIYCLADISAEQVSYENPIINSQVDARYNDYQNELERVKQLRGLA